MNLSGTHARRRSAGGRSALSALGMIALSITVLLASERPADAAYAQIEGSGSTWSKLIVDQWISDVSANGIKVVFTGNGSSAGRRAFAAGTSDFGITEVPYQGSGAQGGDDPPPKNRSFAYLPIVAGGTAFTYQVRVNGKQVKNLRLSGETIAKIFTNKITNWNDPAITKDNNGTKLPSLQIIPVHRSDGSGTTAQFTTWLNSEYSSLWKPFFGRSGITSYYPSKGRSIGANGSDQVMNTISAAQGNGTIGYVEYAYPVRKSYPVVKVLNKAGYFVEPTQYNVAVALTKARLNQDLTQNLTGVYRGDDSRTYPLSSYSYMLLPTGAKDKRMSTSRRQSLADFMFYSLCEGQSKAGKFGYSPLPLNLVQAGFDQLGKLKKADKNVNLENRSVTQCNNPTFVAGNLKANKLAQVAPKPADCDKLGAGPCTTGTGAAPTSVSDAKNGGGAAGGTGPDGGDDAASGGAEVDPDTGLPVGSAAQGGGAASVAVQTELVAGRAGDDKVFGALAVAELLAIVVAPGLVAVYLSRRTRRRTGTPA
ncbi:phosphate ABC transporter substrate-binding protein PstS [Aeromicrobium sp. Root495]|uniref:phosphate ABC transporter substrate-binding protein PstS n=1 Tax=Aeromicrobium sp. Root495 TaxID=1736550 RepID=UPI000A84121A|nr:phosphate ABC transporter substrate-binding protein PstS [Aeromicrobium sp. Root495]